MICILTLVPLLILSLSSLVFAGSSCIAFDITWNLLAFGFNGKDYNAGSQDAWKTGSATDITTSGRPPFNGANTSCYLSQFTNAIYVLGADTSNPAAIYIFDASTKSWSTQATTVNGFEPASFDAILDHDTNVFYALSKGELYSLNMVLLKTANSNALSWNDVQKSGFDTNYQPVMALAQNHIHFLNVPGIPAGSAKIFVIHFSFMQPDPQQYGQFPATHGQAVSFFKDTGVQQEFAFIPDDGSATYVINVETNTTKTLPGPTVKDSLATYFASIDSLVQLSSSGSVSYLPYNNNSASSDSSASWSVVSKLPSALSTASGNGNATGTRTAVATGTATGTSKGAAATSGSNSAIAVSQRVGWGMGGAFGLGVLTLLLS